MSKDMVDQDGFTILDVNVKEDEGTFQIPSPIPAPPKAPDPDFPQMVARFDETEQQRKVVSDKLYTAIQGMDLDLTSKVSPRTVEVQLQAINTFLGVTKDRDSQAISLENLRLKKKDSDTEAANAKIIADFMYNYDAKRGSMPPVPVNLRQADTEIEQTFRVECEPFKEGELEK